MLLNGVRDWVTTGMKKAEVLQLFFSPHFSLGRCVPGIAAPKATSTVYGNDVESALEEGRTTSANWAHATLGSRSVASKGGEGSVWHHSRKRCRLWKVTALRGSSWWWKRRSTSHPSSEGASRVPQVKQPHLNPWAHYRANPLGSHCRSHKKQEGEGDLARANHAQPIPPISMMNWRAPWKSKRCCTSWLQQGWYCSVFTNKWRQPLCRYYQTTWRSTGCSSEGPGQAEGIALTGTSWGLKQILYLWENSSRQQKELELKHLEKLGRKELGHPDGQYAECKLAVSLCSKEGQLNCVGKN